MKSLRPSDVPVTQKAAVLVPLVDISDTPHLLFTRRSLSLSSHSGQVSFPGGKQDPDDVDLVSTALRETEEELGISSSDVDVWILTSVYEAATFRFQEKCEEKQLVYQPIWFTYSVVIINLLLVINSSINFFIYVFTGQHFQKTFLRLIFGKAKTLSSRNADISNGKRLQEQEEIELVERK